MRARPVPVDQLRGPHLVLAHIGHDPVLATLVDNPGERRVDIVRHQVRGVGPVEILLLVLVLVLHLADVLHPVAGVAVQIAQLSRAQLFQQRQQHIARVADDRHRDLDILADLARVDIDVNHLGVRREGAGLAGHAVVEAPADVEQHVALLDGAVDMHPAVHARHPDAERMVLGERADAVQRGDHRDAHALGHRAQLVRRARHRHTIARDDQRLLGRGQQPDRLADLLAVALVVWLVPRQVQLDVPVRDGTGHLCVLRDVDQHRAGPPRRSDVDGLLEDIGQVVGVLDQVVVLGDWHGDAGDIGLLEGVLAEHQAGHLAGDRQQRRAVHHRVGDRRDQVGGAGAAGADANADLPSRAGVALGGVAGALLVPAEHVAQLVAIFPHRIVERHDRAAGDSEHHIDAIADQRLAHNLGTGSLV